MKIAHIISTFPPRIGGMGQVASDECRELAARGHEVSVFTLDYGDVIGTTALPLTVVRLRPWVKSGDAGLVPQLFFRLKGFDIVHLHYPFYGGAEWVWLSRLLHKQRYVVTYHMQAEPNSNFKKAIQAISDMVLAKRILWGAEKVMVVDKSYFANNSFLKQIQNKKKVVELPNGIDTKLFRTIEKKKNEVRTLLFVGNLMPVKRLDLLLEALSNMDDPEIKLIVVGGGYNELDYKFQVRSSKLQDSVLFVGPCTNRAKLAEYYNSADCLVVPSDAESFSLVALEAMACGTPVIVSDVPGMRARVEDGVDGFLFKAGDVNGLVNKLVKFFELDELERQRMGERGRKKVVERYSLEKHVEQLLKNYLEII